MPRERDEAITGGRIEAKSFAEEIERLAKRLRVSGCRRSKGESGGERSFCRMPTRRRSGDKVVWTRRVQRHEKRTKTPDNFLV
jgi:hypothetical protein